MHVKVVLSSVASLLLVILGCVSGNQDADPGRYAGLNVESIINDPGAFYDKEVIVSGEVDRGTTITGRTS